MAKLRQRWRYIRRVFNMILYMHSDEIYDQGLSFDRHRQLSDVEHVIVPAGMNLVAAIHLAISRVLHRRSIWLLILNAHGNRGIIGIGATGIGPANVDSFSELAPYMTPGGRGVEIHSCLAASNTPNVEGRGEGLGIEFLRRMAYFLQAPVRGAYGLQTGQHTQFFGMVRIGDTRGRYETPWVTVFPNGAVVEHDASLSPELGPS